MHQSAVARGISSYNGDDSWEVEKIRGCVCSSQGYYSPGTLHNDSGWRGHDCARKACPTGDPNPHRTDNSSGLEQQRVTCDATSAADLTNSFTLKFRDRTTTAISTGATASDLKTALE